MDKKLKTYVCNECIYGCELKSCAVPVNCPNADSLARPEWRRATDDLPDFLKVNEWVYDEGAREYGLIKYINEEDKKISYRLLGLTSDSAVSYDYSEDYFTEACLLPYNDRDMPKLVGTALAAKHTGDICLVVGSFFNQAERERMITLYSPKNDMLSYGPDKLLEHYDKLNGDPCGNLMRKDENGEWI